MFAFLHELINELSPGEVVAWMGLGVGALLLVAASTTSTIKPIKPREW